MRQISNQTSRKIREETVEEDDSRTIGKTVGPEESEVPFQIQACALVQKGNTMVRLRGIGRVLPVIRAGTGEGEAEQAGADFGEGLGAVVLEISHGTRLDLVNLLDRRYGFRLLSERTLGCIGAYDKSDEVESKEGDKNANNHDTDNDLYTGNNNA